MAGCASSHAHFNGHPQFTTPLPSTLSQYPPALLQLRHCHPLHFICVCVWLCMFKIRVVNSSHAEVPTSAGQLLSPGLVVFVSALVVKVCRFWVICPSSYALHNLGYFQCALLPNRCFLGVHIAHDEVTSLWTLEEARFCNERYFDRVGLSSFLTVSRKGNIYGAGFYPGKWNAVEPSGLLLRH